MRLGLINSAWVQANQPTGYGLRKTKELGFDCVDIFVDPLDIDIQERRLIKDECDRLDLTIVSIASVTFSGSKPRPMISPIEVFSSPEPPSVI